MSRTLFRTRIKFCGMTRAGDVRLASELGVDAIGFIFAAKSKRRVRPEEARAMRQALAPLVDAVAVFADNTADEIREVVKQVRPSLLQFHGSEEDSFCRAFGVPYVKAIPMGEGLAVDGGALQSRFPAAAAFLFDSHGGSANAGSGKTFNWSLMPQTINRPTIVAGGLSPTNVFEAITTTLPWGVDAASGIEVSPGIKDGNLMRKFVEEVRRADCCVDPDIPAGTHAAHAANGLPTA